MPKTKKATKLCYVIMPFSDTDSCSAGQWTTIFNGLIKPAVEEAGLGYTCVRSKATTGSMINKIVQDLYSANVVIADLTDKKPNVFYELGVRHTLRHRTILIAQSRDDIPSDLDGYASHAYDWNTQPGQAEFRAKIHDSLQHIEEDPDRSDNPVSDFLQERSFRILEFQREENARKLRALIEEIELVRMLFARIAEQAKGKKGHERPIVYRQHCPALDHLIATQYVYNELFAYQARRLRAALEVIAGQRFDSAFIAGLLSLIEVMKRNVERVLAAYESGDALDKVDLEDWEQFEDQESTD